MAGTRRRFGRRESVRVTRTQRLGLGRASGVIASWSGKRDSNPRPSAPDLTTSRSRSAVTLGNQHHPAQSLPALDVCVGRRRLGQRVRAVDDDAKRPRARLPGACATIGTHAPEIPRPLQTEGNARQRAAALCQEAQVRSFRCSGRLGPRSSPFLCRPGS